MIVFRRGGWARRGKTRGFTLIELSIASGISIMVMIAVVSTVWISGRTIREIYGPTRSRTARMNALNQIRFKLCDAKIGSAVISDSNHRIRFVNPNLGPAVVSEFFFNTNERALYYDNDVNNSPPPYAVAKGPINVTFTDGNIDLDPPDFLVPKGNGAIVTVWVQTSADLAYSRVDLRDGETVVYLRNP